MSTTITTKYAVGDVVYHAWITTVRKRHECPDCKGSRKWKATSPAGSEFEFSCPRCSSRYQSDDALSLDYSEYAPLVRSLTIGSIQVNTAPHFSEPERDHVNYMCVETEVGSGSVYPESDLFATEAEAQVAADARAKEQTVNTEWMAKLYARSLDISDYQLGSAMIRAAKNRQASISVKVSMLFDDLRDCETMEQVKECIERGFKSDD